MPYAGRHGIISMRAIGLCQALYLWAFWLSSGLSRSWPVAAVQGKRPPWPFAAAWLWAAPPCEATWGILVMMALGCWGWMAEAALQRVQASPVQGAPSSWSLPES